MQNAPLESHNSGTNVRKMMCINPMLDLVNMNAYIKLMLDLVNMNAYIKFGEILYICSQDIEGKQNWCKSRAITLYKCRQNDE